MKLVSVTEANDAHVLNYRQPGKIGQ
jgi:hypothetical protein